MGAAAAILRAGPRPAASRRRTIRRRAQGFLRYADVRIRNAAWTGLGAVQQDYGRAICDTDGRRAACPGPPPIDAGLLISADRTAPGEHHRDRRRDAGLYRG